MTTAMNDPNYPHIARIANKIVADAEAWVNDRHAHPSAFSGDTMVDTDRVKFYDQDADVMVDPTESLWYRMRWAWDVLRGRY